MKVEAALITNNSPYAEVRAVVDNHDDPDIPCSTIRAWVIGLIFSVLLGFINQLFSIRFPAITVAANVAQLLSYPLGKGWELVMPDWGVTMFGVRHSLNPGPFSKKEHMLITIMANVAYQTPYTANIIWTQYLPRKLILCPTTTAELLLIHRLEYFNQQFAGQFSYQILIALGTNLVGYGLAGIARRFLVYPAYCVWPASLVTIALNAAFHTERNVAVEGPFRSIWKISRLKFFLWTFGAMFIYFWFPNYLFSALATFSWITWIAPDNVHLEAICGMNKGLGFNPWPTWDWNTLLYDSTDPLMVPFFATFSKFLGMFLSAFVVLGIWYSNAYNAAYLPINTNRIYDNKGKLYDVQQAIDDRGIFDAAKYEQYSPAYLTAANMTVYLFFFAVYPATLVHAWLNHRYELTMGFKNMWRAVRRRKADESGEYKDVHNRLMAKYPEVPEWWYMIVLAIACVFGVAGIAGWETYTTPGVVFYGIALTLVFLVPVGIIKAMTGIEVTLNVIAEFIGGSWVAGNALAMNYFKAFGYVTCAHAVWFSNDLKLAHYLHVSPRLLLIVPKAAYTAFYHIDSSSPHLLGTDDRHHRVHIRVHGHPQLPDEPDPRRVYRGRAQPLHLPRHQHLLHRRRPVGHHRPDQGLRQGRPVHGAPRRLPHRLHRAPRLLLHPQEGRQALRLAAQRPPRRHHVRRADLGALLAQLRHPVAVDWLRVLGLPQGPLPRPLVQVQLCPVRVVVQRHRHRRHCHLLQRPVQRPRGPLVGQRHHQRRLRGQGLRAAQAA
jgi:OPT family small oligopeptide transporter